MRFSRGEGLLECLEKLFVFFLREGFPEPLPQGFFFVYAQKSLFRRVKVGNFEVLSLVQGLVNRHTAVHVFEKIP